MVGIIGAASTDEELQKILDERRLEATRKAQADAAAAKAAADAKAARDAAIARSEAQAVAAYGPTATGGNDRTLAQVQAENAQKAQVAADDAARGVGPGGYNTNPTSGISGFGGTAPQPLPTTPHGPMIYAKEDTEATRRAALLEMGIDVNPELNQEKGAADVKAGTDQLFAITEAPYSGVESWIGSVYSAGRAGGEGTQVTGETDTARKGALELLGLDINPDLSTPKADPSTSYLNALTASAALGTIQGATFAFRPKLWSDTVTGAAQVAADPGKAWDTATGEGGALSITELPFTFAYMAGGVLGGKITASAVDKVLGGSKQTRLKGVRVNEATGYEPDAFGKGKGVHYKYLEVTPETESSFIPRRVAGLLDDLDQTQGDTLFGIATEGGAEAPYSLKVGNKGMERLLSGKTVSTIDATGKIYAGAKESFLTLDDGTLSIKKGWGPFKETGAGSLWNVETGEGLTGTKPFRINVIGGAQVGEPPAGPGTLKLWVPPSTGGAGAVGPGVGGVGGPVLTLEISSLKLNPVTAVKSVPSAVSTPLSVGGVVGAAGSISKLDVPASTKTDVKPTSIISPNQNTGILGFTGIGQFPAQFPGIDTLPGQGTKPAVATVATSKPFQNPKPVTVILPIEGTKPKPVIIEKTTPIQDPGTTFKPISRIEEPTTTRPPIPFIPPYESPSPRYRRTAIPFGASSTTGVKKGSKTVEAEIGNASPEEILKMVRGG